VPAPNATVLATTVPGAAAGLPAGAPMLSVPTEPELVAIKTVELLVRVVVVGGIGASS